MKKPVLFILLLLMVLLLGSCGRTKQFDLTKYVQYELSGLNGKGKMFLSLDEQLYADVLEKNEKISAEALRKIIERDVVLSASRDRLLANGDEAVIEVSVLSEDADLKKTGIQLVPGSKKVTVAGLPEAREVDLTQDLLIEAQGFDGEGTVSAVFAEKLYNTIADLSKDMTTEKARELLQASVPITANRSGDLADGDEITVTVDVSNANAAFLEQGLVLSGGTVSYTVSGLKPLKHITASDIVSYSLTGTAPYLTVDFSLSEKTPQELKPYITLPAGKRLTFRKGEVREFEIKYNEEELKKRGYVCDEAAFPVSPDGLEIEKYLEELSEINETDMQKLKDEAGEAAYATALYETKHLTYNEGNVFGDTLEKVSLSSMILFVRKQYSDSKPFNYLMLVYEADYAPTTSIGEHNDQMYVTLTYENATLDPSGNIIGSEPAVEIKLPESVETDIAVLKADYKSEEIREETGGENSEEAGEENSEENNGD